MFQFSFQSQAYEVRTEAQAAERNSRTPQNTTINIIIKKKKIMSNNKENLMALKEMLKNEIREDAQAVYEFEKNVNETSRKAGGRKRVIATSDYITNRVMGDMCNMIIDSSI